MGTHRTIAAQIMQHKRYAVLALTDTRGTILEEVRATGALAEHEQVAHMHAASERRVDIHASWTSRDRDIHPHLDPNRRSNGLHTLGMVRAARRIGHEVSRATRPVVLRFSSVQTCASAVRGHWGVNTVCMGCPMWHAGTMMHASGSVMPPAIWRSDATSVRRSCARSHRPACDARLAGTTPLSCRVLDLAQSWF